MDGAVAWALATGGPSALLALVVLLILTGRLTTRRTLRDCIADRDEWRRTALTKDETISLQAKQIDQLSSVARTAESLLSALGKAANK